MTTTTTTRTAVEKVHEEVIIDLKDTDADHVQEVIFEELRTTWGHLGSALRLESVGFVELEDGSLRISNTRFNEQHTHLSVRVIELTIESTNKEKTND